ncbi:coiled-coil domain-containing protein 43 [Takifugu rubripes]|uniref:Coiled-coil domain-containing protein 43 n=1 Tax=Takifugu rubripes TaxID=31033 RepID=A0A3B5JZ64_TAKRU|nr:coiled-coil domain-containing protein 43 [Takifugu rubripes]|eukprot:XP_003964839.1 PREDICTED: coiled-coil domain-containing protein 43 [Takifugu rubripes]
MAAPMTDTGEFESWLNDRLDSLEVDRDVYGTYILGVLQEEETDEEKEDALNGILSAFVDEDSVEDVCKQIIKRWTEWNHQSAAKRESDDAEVRAIASMIEKQAQIVVKQKVSAESKTGKEAVLAQYANITDEEDEAEEEESASGTKFPGSEQSLFKNTNVEEVLSRQLQKRIQAREDAQKKKETDKMQREKDKLAKQDRKEKEKKRTQKGERKR